MAVLAFLNSPFGGPVVAVILGVIGSVFALIQDLPASAIIGIGGGWLAGGWAIFGLKERWQAMQVKSPILVSVCHAGMKWTWLQGRMDGPFCPKDGTRLIQRNERGQPETMGYIQRNWRLGGETYFDCPACNEKYIGDGTSPDVGEMQLKANHLLEAEAARLEA